MFLKTSLSLLVALGMGAVFTGSPRETPREELKVDVPARPAPSPLGMTRISLNTLEKLGEGFKKVYDLAEPPDLFSIGQVQMSATKPGESAKGVVVLEKSGELYLDSTPCESDWDKKQVFSFNRPYATEAGDEKLCTDPARTYKTTKVTKN